VRHDVVEAAPAVDDWRDEDDDWREQTLVTSPMRLPSPTR
jgi:hypothetical protein